jgi:hypothetical protein
LRDDTYQDQALRVWRGSELLSNILYTGDLRSKVSWIAAHVFGALALLWIALANGFPLVFPDSGSYLRVGTELHYLSDRPVIYGLMIAPFARIGGLWSIVAAQALLTTFIIGIAFKAITGRRSAILLFLTLLGLAAMSSLPWFVGQIMPDFLTGLVALLVFQVLFAPDGGTRWSRWWPPALLVPLIAAHLSHLPLAAALIAIGGAIAVSRRIPLISMRLGRAILALVVALTGLCCLNFIGAQRFAPSVESNMFLAARLFDGRVGQPVLDDLCRTEVLRLCSVRTMVSDPRRAMPGQDYLWTDYMRARLAAHDVDELRTEEMALVRRAIRERPSSVLRLAFRGWLEQLINARSADGMVPYGEDMQIARQIRVHFPASAAAFQASREQQGTLQEIAVYPVEWIALAVAIMAPFILYFAIRRGDSTMIGLSAIVITTILVNAAVCGILSGPADRYQSRVIWLLPLLGALALSRKLARAVPALVEHGRGTATANDDGPAVPHREQPSS